MTKNEILEEFFREHWKLVDIRQVSPFSRLEAMAIEIFVDWLGEKGVIEND